MSDQDDQDSKKSRCSACIAEAEGLSGATAFLCGAVAVDTMGISKFAPNLCDTHALQMYVYYGVVIDAAKDAAKAVEEQMDQAVVTPRVPNKEDMN